MSYFKRLPIVLCWLLRSYATAQSADTAYFDKLIKQGNEIYYAYPDSSLQITDAALQYAITHKLEVRKAIALQARAKTLILKGDVEPAIESLKQAEVIFKRHRLQERLAAVYSSMSTAFGKIDQESESVFLIKKACDIYRELGNTSGLFNSLTNLSNYYVHSDNYVKAHEILAEAKNYVTPGSERWFFYYINMGLLYTKQQKYAAAKIAFDSCVAISRRNKMLDSEMTALTNLADVFRLTGNTQEAIVSYSIAIVKSAENKLPIEEMDALQGIIPCLEKNGNYKEAFMSQRRLDRLSDSLFTIEKIKHVTAIEKKLLSSEKEKTIALQKLSMEEGARRQEISKKRIIYLVAGSLCLGIGLFFTVFIYLRTRKQKQELEVQKAKVDRLNVLNQKIFSVIAHDFKSPLITLQMLTDLLDKEGISQKDLPDYTADLRNQITQSNQILENLLNWARTELNLSQHKNQFCDARHIAGEIAKELAFTAGKKSVKIINVIPEDTQFDIPPDILRIIIRNLLSNAVKYSFEGGEVTIGMKDAAGLFVADQGTGIDSRKINELFTGTVKSKLGTFNETGFGLGLYISYELISKFGGKIRVEQNQPKGTVFIFDIPRYAQN